MTTTFKSFSQISSLEKESVILVENLSKIYISKEFGKFTALNEINFTVKKGEIFGLIGPDGAGKTTTFNILGGVMAASGGKIQILGRTPREARLSMGYVPQKLSIYLDLTVKENLEYSASLRKVDSFLFKKQLAKYLDVMGLEKFKHRLANNLSGGMKQKLALSCVLIANPEILLLDEPTTGIDPISRRELWDDLVAIANEGVTIVVATPYFDEAERCHRMAFLREGIIEQIGTVSQLRQSIGCKRLELRVSPLDKANSILLQSLGEQIIDVQTFGDRLDILVKNIDLAQAQIRQILESENLTLLSKSAEEPTLENVFVIRCRKKQEEIKLLEFPRFKAVKNVHQNKNSLHLNDVNNSTNYLPSFFDNSLKIKTDNDDHIAIQTVNLCKKFGNFEAVKGIDFKIHYGEIYGLLGANGAGKTTTIKMLCGLQVPTSGKISLAGVSKNLRSSHIRAKIGYMSQKFTLYDDLTIIENLKFYCGVYGVPNNKIMEKIDWVLETCDLKGKETLLTGNLPGGWKQRVAFGASVMHEPDILFLDEPTSGVDPIARRQFWRLINDFASQGTAILVTTHYLEEAENCHRMGFLVSGKLMIEGTATQIKAAQTGHLIEMVTDDIQQSSNLLKSQFTTGQIAIFGDRLHIVLNDYDREIDKIKLILQENQINIKSLNQIPFTLEDAFIGIVTQHS